MLRVTTSNRLDALADALADDLVAERGARPDPFAPITVAVPSALVGRFVRLHLARRLGVAANLSFPFLGPFLADRIPPDAGVRVLDRRRLRALLCGALAQPALLARPELAPVRAYLDAAGRDDHDAVDRRRVQLANNLATLFDGYALERPELLAAWPRGQTIRPTNDPGWWRAEGWQRALWLAVHGERGLLADIQKRTGERWLPLPAALAALPAGALVLPAHAHLFGFSYLPRADAALLERLGAACELHLYTPNPCREFWEDVRRPWQPGEPPALALWGTASREHVASLLRLTQGDLRDRSLAPEGDSLLARVQRDTLQCRAPEADAVVDGSIRLLACRGAQREAEVIAARIWELVAADPTLRFSDVAVLVPSGRWDEYRPRLAAAFHGHHGIPHAAVEVPLAAGSRIAEAVDLLLALPLGRFTRPELLRLLVHPAVQARCPGEPDQWVAWCEALGIVRGADGDDHAGTYIEDDRLSWDQGARRLAMGVLMAGEPSGDDRVAAAGASHYLVEEVAPDLGAEAARFVLLVRSLVADARYCRGARLPLAEWRELLDAMIAAYVGARDDDEERDLGRCRDAIACLAQADLDGRAHGYRVACELVRAELAARSRDVGEPLGGGVLLAPLAPRRGLPLRVVFLAGLGEGDLPARDRRDPLDVGQATRYEGDVGPRERDLCAFLETLGAARERLYLSWVAHDEKSDEPRQPSAVVLDLLDLLERYVGAEARPRLVEHHPLRRHDEAYFTGGVDRPVPSPAARGEAAARTLRRHFEAATHVGGGVTLDGLRAAVPAPAWPALRERLGLLPLPAADTTRAAVEAGAPAVITLRIAELRRFLECPLQASARVLLGLREDDDDLVEVGEEPLMLDAAERAELLRAVLLEKMAGGGELGALYDRRSARLALRGRAPTGLFADLARTVDLDLLRRWEEGAVAELGGALPPMAPRWLGRADDDGADRVLPPLAIDAALRDGRRLRVELVGACEAVDAGGALSVTFIPKVVKKNHALRPFVDHAVLSAAGAARGAREAILVGGEGKTRRIRLDAWAPGEAARYLADLCGDLLGGVHDYLLPCEAVFDAPRRGASVAATVDDMRLTPQSISSKYGPIRNADRYPPPPEAEAEAMAARRFGSLLPALEKWNG